MSRLSLVCLLPLALAACDDLRPAASVGMSVGSHGVGLSQSFGVAGPNGSASVTIRP